MNATGPIFPVSLQPLFTADGKEATGVKAVVRDDVNKPIATVSNRYCLIKHEDVLNEANKFIGGIGGGDFLPVYRSERDGARMSAEYTFKEIKQNIVGDTIGLRVYVENSYDGSCAIRIRVSALVLSCLNGMALPRSVFHLSLRHTQSVKEKLVFPDREVILDAFSRGADFCNSLSAINLSDTKFMEASFDLARHIDLPESLQETMTAIEQKDFTGWDLMQNFTNIITHQMPKVSFTGKMARLSRVTRWFASGAIDEYR